MLRWQHTIILQKCSGLEIEDSPAQIWLIRSWEAYLLYHYQLYTLFMYLHIHIHCMFIFMYIYVHYLHTLQLL